MARGRFISESVAKDMRLNSLSVEAELVYLMAIPHLDRDGLIEGDTEVLYGTVCPKRRIFIDRMGEFIQEWVSVGLVAMYDTEQGSVLWFKGFTKNQLGLRYERETPSTFPPPPGHTRDGKTGIVPIPNAPVTTPKKDEETPIAPPDNSVRQESGTLPEASDNCVAQWQAEVEVEDQAKHTAPASPALSRADEEDALIKLAYHTIGSFPPHHGTPNRKNATKAAFELIESYGYRRCESYMPQLRERHVAGVTNLKRGISAPVQYLQMLMQGEIGIPTTLNATPATVDFALEDLMQ